MSANLSYSWTDQGFGLWYLDIEGGGSLSGKFYECKTIYDKIFSISSWRGGDVVLCFLDQNFIRAQVYGTGRTTYIGNIKELRKYLKNEFVELFTLDVASDPNLPKKYRVPLSRIIKDTVGGELSIASGALSGLECGLSVLEE